MAHSNDDRAVTVPPLDVCESPLRWAGGKRRLVPLLRDVLPTPVDRLIEPFFGGGSVSFGLAVRARGADTNSELVNFYDQCAANPLSIIDKLRALGDDRATYNRVREAEPSTALERAVRFTYLNRTSYFGLYRTNQQGKYNVPYGGGGRLNIESLEAGLIKLSRVLDRVEIENIDYLALLAQVESTDVVFLDPPYGAKGDFPFRRYGSLLFTHADHRRLAAEAERCRSLGATVLVTLPPDKELIAAYPGWATVGERRRGNRIVELCITPQRLQSPTTASGEWKYASHDLADYTGALLPTGT